MVCNNASVRNCKQKRIYYHAICNRKIMARCAKRMLNWNPKRSFRISLLSSYAARTCAAWQINSLDTESKMLKIGKLRKLANCVLWVDLLVVGCCTQHVVHVFFCQSNYTKGKNRGKVNVISGNIVQFRAWSVMQDSRTVLFD